MSAERRHDITDYLCFAESAYGFICTLPPSHDGDHIAKAGAGLVVDQWPGRAVTEGQEDRR